MSIGIRERVIQKLYFVDKQFSLLHEGIPELIGHEWVAWRDIHYWGGVLQFAIWETLSNDNVKEPNLMQVNRLDMSWCHCMDNN